LQAWHWYFALLYVVVQMVTEKLGGGKTTPATRTAPDRTLSADSA
jgi:hypothetical protein